jgi:Mrp family chromosome partitioning ATPase
MDDCESFAVSLEGPRVPDLILADTLAVQEAICYCEPAAVDAGFEQSDLLVWHPTTRDMIISEIDMVVVPRVVSPISLLKAADNNTDAAVLEATTQTTSFEPPIAEAESVAADVPTNRSVIVPPPLPKTLIPPAPEEQFESLPASHGVAATEPIVQIETEPAAKSLASQTESRQEAITETQASANETSAAAPATRPTFAPLSSFNPRLVGEVVRPQLEVDRFAWPEVCGLLLGRVEAEFIRLAEELAARAAHSNQVVAWTGCQRGEGRTTSLLCMAQRLAAAGRKCVLVDADFSRPELARRLGISAQVGWEEVVAGAAQLTDVLIGSLEDRLALLPRRQRVAAGTHPGAGAASAAMFDLLREAFDVVLLDVGPMAGEAELADMASCAAAANVGGAYLVFDSRNITTSEMTATADQLREVGIEVWGAIENFRR